MNAVLPRLIRVQDRLTIARDASPVWRINPRTGTLDARAGLSWTGIRPYRTANGVVRVLRRPEQVNSPGHRKTLHRLPQPELHPPGDVNISPTNIETLNCGWTGDDVDVEVLGGYARPVGNMSVFRVSTIANMVDDDTWAEYCELFPDVVGTVQHSVGNRPRTGTSLGYNALWYGPHVESEIVSERDDGALVGEWMGPNGPEQYDIEHIIDPDCEIVKRLQAEVGFKPQMLGANHNAIGLQALGGRGAEQAELMRIVDSRSLPITADQSRVLTRVALQVPLMKSRATVQPRIAQQWRDAATQTFDEIGSVDPVWAARQAELSKILTENQPVPRCSITYGTNEFGVLETAFQFEGDAQPWTTVPAMPLEKMTREYIVDLYLWSRNPHDEILAPGGRQLPECAADPAARDSSNASKVRIMNKKTIEIGIGRDNARTISKLGLDKLLSIVDLTLALDEVDANAAHAKLMEMQGVLADLLQMVGEAKGDIEDMKEGMKDMMPAAEAQAKVDEYKAMLAEAEKMLAESKSAEAKATGDMYAAKKMADDLTAAIAPYKAAEFEQLKTDAIAAGHDAAKIGECKDAAEIRRIVVLANPKLAAKYSKDTADDVIAAAFDGVWAARPAVTLVPEKPKQTSAGRTSTLSGVPPVQLQRAADSNDASTKVSTADEMDG